ncbi:LacI family DNA-binding transcriptional regulator [Brachybacterium hainanense]|uniref:LacI family DNA-binding transcriptional regulator n=1 Tax=Brachybacterium hainanense TaxID=1541174 RepID=A0ABV6R7D1_9MICO
MASIKDVARAAGVSIGTVSNVLNRPEIVSPSRRSAVETAIAELGYVRNDAARQLKAGRSLTVGCIVLDISNPFYAQLAAGAELAAEASGIGVLTGNSGHRTSRERLQLSLFEEQRVRGILLASRGGTEELVRAIHDRGTPIILMETDEHVESFCSVSTDDAAGGRMAVAHLLEQGRRRIAVIAAKLELRQVAARIAGASAAVAEVPGASLEIIEADDLTVLAGRAAGSRIASRPAGKRPDGVFCINDLMAAGAMQAFAFQDRIRMPEDIALIGYDDIAFSRSTIVPLSSVSQAAEMMGRTAYALLEEEVVHGGGHVHRHVTFRPELVVRRSTDPDAADPLDAEGA